ncbi:MAG: alpha/beta hydrolase [Gammaproteobacteria bacterium]|nr:alpha/beta hydrolase [Gammaproteobacteria bacterium]
MGPELAKQIETQTQVFALLIVEPDGVRLYRDELDAVPVEWTEPLDGPTDPSRVVLYLHGGGYSSGLAAWARRATARLALGLGCRVVAPDYRLAPRFAFPAAHEDVLAVYRHLIGAGGFAPENVAVAGDSAGGALSVSLCADARDAGVPIPACVITNSLWADLALNTPSLDDPVRNGFDIRREMVEFLSATLLGTGDIDPKDGRHSPVYRDLAGLPPLLVQAAGRDVCHDDSIRLAASARAAGVSVTVTEYPEAEHIWILNGPWRIAYPQDYPGNPAIRWVDSGAEAPEAVPAMDEMVSFIRRHTGG